MARFLRAAFPITRRTFLLLPAAAAVGCSTGSEGSYWADQLRDTGSRALSPEGEALTDVNVLREWRGPFCKLRLENRTESPQRIGEVLAFDVPHQMPAATRLYAESYQMLSQTDGTLGDPQPIGNYSDVKHYRLPQPEGAFTAYNVVYLQPAPGNNLVLAFTSCRRFAGKFHLRPTSIEIALDGDGIEIAPGQTIDLEEFAVLEGSEHGALFDQLAARLGENHPPILGPTPPEGWCSWYCFGPDVTARQVMENLEFIAEHFPALRYIQIDDGYQAAMGDWLATGKAFGGDVRAVLRQIRERGFEPAIWVAPFIAEAGSQVFQQHPDWFMKDAQGQPLAADQVTFGGWRRGPWYAMDGSHPEVQQHLESVFRTMREEWGVTYFKLDANYWGTMPQGRLHDPAATRIEAYRRGMEAVRRGAGNAFLLGCNHPLWPSLGLIHGSRSSNDIRRSWDRFRQTARENLHRNWQNGRLWWNDPDVVLLTGDLSEDEFHFHAAAIYASGGMFLAGDDLPRLPAARLAMLRKLSPPTAQAAVFDPELRVGRARHNSRELIFFFNWNDAPESFEAQVPANATVTDFWTGEAGAAQGGKIQIADVAPHAARILVV